MAEHIGVKEFRVKRVTPWTTVVYQHCIQRQRRQRITSDLNASIGIGTTEAWAVIKLTNTRFLFGTWMLSCQLEWWPG